MEKISAPWNGKDLIPDWDFLADNGCYIESKNRFVFFVSNDLVECVYVGNRIELIFRNADTFNILKERFYEMANDSNSVYQLDIDFQLSGLALTINRYILNVYTYWLVE